ncbi:hypothetical protein SAMN05216359_101127 [Roseateles sp. YR242]|uniref:protealysin inhibitor emfourin n=1 Tax=Roseateles sp. YR242 TaxID=1855305 RepID=UPI0008C2E4AD|nr:protealysin inhibitor emfourin [Roseateles sp. YR242]SEK23754.1 hypothetical protein SAMN05216359_101127 [Roseateles sp. YR242]
MKIRYQRDGGLAYLPGLQRPLEFDAQALDDPRREELSRLVTQSCFFEQPAQVGAVAKGAADHTTETLTIEMSGVAHQVRIVGTPQDEALVALLQVVRAAAAVIRKRGG